jgi:glycine betaine catabolism B
MFSTRIRDSPYKKRASTLEEGSRVKVRGPEQQQSSSAANDWKGEYGRIDKALILKYLDTNTLNNSIFYICGPPSMLKAMQSLLQDNLEIPKERIKVEEFTGY